MIATSATTGCATRSQHLRERAARPCDAIEGGAMMLVLRLAFPLLIIALFFASSVLLAAEPTAIESGLVVSVQGEEKRVGLDQALALLKVPWVSIALIDKGRIAFARTYGDGATPDTLHQAASLSKVVAAIGAMRLVEAGTLHSTRT